MSNWPVAEIDDLVVDTMEYVALRRLKAHASELKESARRAVEKAADEGRAPGEISRVTGVPYRQVAAWMILNRHITPEETS